MQPLDGSAPKWLAAAGKVYYDAQGKSLSMTGTLLDITEQKRDEERKNDFIDMVSHELKTPLTTLNAIQQVLSHKLKDSDDPFIPDALGRATFQTRRMSNLINSFLTVSRYDSGKIQVDKAPFDICSLISEIVAVIQLTARNHRIEQKGCTTLLVNADREKIGSVISNLLTNAIKYCPKNPRITIICTNTATELTVCVTDDGPGIPAADKGHLFERYFRSKSADKTQVSGFGIGLYLSADYSATRGAYLGGKRSGKRRGILLYLTTLVALVNFFVMYLQRSGSGYLHHLKKVLTKNFCLALLHH